MAQQTQILEAQSPAQAEQMSQFFKSVWGGAEDVVPLDLILALNHVGAYAYLAQRDGEIVAASFGVRGEFEGEQILHSHVTASTLPGIGFELKKHQREWARDRGISAITWTFDPLVRRNCVFNFEKLGAVAIEYLPNFYGEMKDDINRGDASDRLLAYWSVEELAKPEAGGEQIFVELPADIEALRKSDLAEALDWRDRVRSVLQPALEDDYFVSGMTADRTSLVLTRI
jgi:predicted GNAT superfamily acetyltransferase